jgi:hypothetical protein
MDSKLLVTKAVMARLIAEALPIENVAAYEPNLPKACRKPKYRYTDLTNDATQPVKSSYACKQRKSKYNRRCKQ